ncbi:tetraacyldisaccharide 4'-kinase [Pseudorhodoplanes sp.]|uniref:tetraacyldisaccharide 4'-kinase n=1 Tax=Pseudorhodoplanes sp. TaxID=1934341 RepID=UPI002C1EA26D|nr:tetraacyldisaccharide 4'-kinase [Pseudorhodoplanes sp.]HWV51890.1 tetraacyldisaccharide 4'-kinase [Pseudorhodoplanes sp.]
MREPDFWWQKPGIAAGLLSPVALIYGFIAGSRMRRAGFKANIPVICVGNFTLGGSGKTPTAIAIAQRLIAKGERPFFLTRGYGGTLAGPVRVDPARHRATDVGDEPLLLARAQPTIVSRVRAAGARCAQDAGATIIVMDDGLQNPSLAKDLSIAVVDARRGLGNARVFPAGPLRAPFSIQVAQVHAILAVGSGDGTNQVAELARRNRLPLVRAQLRPAPDTAIDMAGRKAFAFAGIGDPEKFFITLSSVGIEPTVTQPFADHHAYSEDDATRILARCEADSLIPVTTEKDMARLQGQTGARGQLAEAARVLPVTLQPDDPATLDSLLDQVLKAQR